MGAATGAVHSRSEGDTQRATTSSEPKAHSSVPESAKSLPNTLTTVPPASGPPAGVHDEIGEQQQQQDGPHYE